MKFQYVQFLFFVVAISLSILDLYYKLSTYKVGY